MLPGLWACWKKRYLVGGTLAIAGFLGVGGLTAAFAFAGVVLYPVFPFELATGISLAVFLATAIAILVLTKRLPIVPRASTNEH
jgi:hypothetical protein